MQIVTEKITLDELKKMSEKMFESMVKAVVDIAKEIMVVDAELHADEENLLLENDSDQQNLWGINLYPEKFGAYARISCRLFCRQQSVWFYR